jgi:Ca2+-binding RTX toxin-like protein
LRDEDLGPLFAEVNPEVIKENTNPTTVRRRIEGGDGDDVLHGRPGNDRTVADNVMDGGSDKDIFYGGDDDDMLSPAKGSRLGTNSLLRERRGRSLRRILC